MKKFLLTMSVLSMVGLSFSAAQAQTSAQNYPERPIRMVVPFPPGGGTDIIARGLAVAIQQNQPNWTFVPDNRAGAGGAVGLDALAKSAADGYNIALGQTSNLTISPWLQDKLGYDPKKDFVPVALVASSPVVIVVPQDSPYKTLKDLIEDARANPGKIDVASPGNGTVAHLSLELLHQVANIKTQHIPYKGFSAAANDLLGGQVDVYVGSVPTAMPQIAAGKLRPLAVTSSERAPQLPEVPTIAESGFPGFDAVTWYGIVAPTGTPQHVIDTLNREIDKAIKSEEYSKRLQAQGAKGHGGSAQEFGQLIERDLAMWRKVVQQSGAKVD